MFKSLIRLLVNCLLISVFSLSVANASQSIEESEVATVNLQKFVIIGVDGSNGVELRKVYRSEHLKYWGDFNQQGRLVLGGPLTDKFGSLIVVRAESFTAAQLMAKNDPYVKHGIFKETQIHPFTQVFPAP